MTDPRAAVLKSVPKWPRRATSQAVADGAKVTKREALAALRVLHAAGKVVRDGGYQWSRPDATGRREKV